MGEVIAHLRCHWTGSADPDDGCEELFGFYQAGDVAAKLSEGLQVAAVTPLRIWKVRRSHEQDSAVHVGVCGRVHRWA